MKDPCIDCIVQVNCSQICEKRQNYTALCNDSMKYFNSHKINGEYNHKVIIQNPKQFTEAVKRRNEVWSRNNKILSKNLKKK